MKKMLSSSKLLLILLCFLSWDAIAQTVQTAEIVNKGKIVVKNGGYLIVKGNATNKANGDNAIANSGTIRLTGNFTNNASSGNLLSGSTGKVILNGSSSQTIGGSRSTYFTNLKLDNINGFTINKETFVEKVLDLTKGIVTTSFGKELSLTSTASYTGGSNTAYVGGPMKRTGSSAFIYPVGDGAHIAKLGLTAINSSNTFTVSYNASMPINYTQYSGANITGVSSVEYWEVTPASGAPQTNMTLYYGSGSFSGISDPSLLAGVHYNGSQWEEVAHKSHTGNATSGSLTFGPVTSYSNSKCYSYAKFTFATTNNVTNPLPVEMLSFDVEAMTSSIGLSWATASELNADVFEIQRSTNAKDFETIGKVQAAGNSNTVRTYSYNDKEVVFNQDYYYRLKQIDFDGKFEYTDIRMARLEANNEISINVYPNPTKDFIIIQSNIEENIDLNLYNINGEKVLSKTNSKANNTKLNINTLPAGTYILRMNSLSKTYKTIRITKL